MKTLALVTAALLLHPIAAHAGKHCGGGADGGSSEHHSSSHSSSSNETSWSASPSSSSSVAEPATGCLDDSDVVGYRHCTKFGSGWSLQTRIPRLFIELGTNVRQFSAGGDGARSGTVWHGSESFTYRMVAPTSGDTNAGAVVSSLRIGFGLPHGMYTGIEGELGGLTSSPITPEMMTSGVFGTPQLESRTAMVLGGAGFVGARTSLGRASIAVEAAGGARDVRYRYTSTYHDCEDTAVVSVVHPMLEARARAEMWLGPWFTLGAQAGANVAARGDWMTGVYLGFHSRAFGGSR